MCLCQLSKVIVEPWTTTQACHATLLTTGHLRLAIGRSLKKHGGEGIHNRARANVQETRDLI